MSGMNIIIFACEGSMPGLGVIFCMTNCETIMMSGRIWMGSSSGWDRSEIQSQCAPRISIVTAKTL